MKKVYVIDAVRTPIGKYGGALAAVRPDDLLAYVIRTLLLRNQNIDPDAIEDVISSLTEGAWALTMWDKKHQELIMLRNDQRTLYYCYSEDRRHMAWASELWMLYAAFSRNNLKMDGQPIILRPDHCLSFKLPKRGDKFQAPEGRTIKGNKKPPHYMSEEWWVEQKEKERAEAAQKIPFETIGPATVGPHSKVNQQSTKEDLEKVTFLNKSVTDDGKLDTSKFRNPYKFPDGTVMKKPEFLDLIKRGHSCVYCNTHTPTWGEPVMFLEPDPRGAPQYACKNCISDPEKVVILRAIR